jgi:hypothetical protein
MNNTLLYGWNGHPESLARVHLAFDDAWRQGSPLVVT